MTGFARWWGRTPTTPSPDIDLEGALHYLTKKARSEARSGKAISAAQAAQVRAAIDILKSMLAAANTN